MTVERALLTLLIVLVVAASFGLMFLGWRRAAARAAHIAEPATPFTADVVAGPWEGRFLGTTYAGRWLDRVHAHSLGVRSMASVSVTQPGITVERPGARSFGIPWSDVLAVRADSGIAGRAYETGGIIVVTFRLGDERIECGVRFPGTADHVAALAAMTPTEVSS